MTAFLDTFRVRHWLGKYPAMTRQYGVLRSALINQRREYERLLSLTPRPGPLVTKLKADLDRADAAMNENAQVFERLTAQLETAYNEAVRRGKVEPGAVRFERPGLGEPVSITVVVLVLGLALIAGSLTVLWALQARRLDAQQRNIQPMVAANAAVLRGWQNAVRKAQDSGRLPPGPPELVPVPNLVPSGSGSSTPLLIAVGVSLVVGLAVLRPRRSS